MAKHCKQTYQYNSSDTLKPLRRLGNHASSIVDVIWMDLMARLHERTNPLLADFDNHYRVESCVRF